MLMYKLKNNTIQHPIILSLTLMVNLVAVLTWCLYFLATHEEIQDKVYQEIMNVLDDKDLVDDSNLDKFM